MRIGLLGGVPPAIGGGGLEVQIERTGAALRARGHDTVRVEQAPAGATWDVLHAFGAEGGTQQTLQHWTRARSPLVISPVLVVSPGAEELALRLASRIPGVATVASERRQALARADALVAITTYEKTVLQGLTRRRVPIEVVPNGVDAITPGAPPAAGLQPGYVLLIGSIGERKRQREVVEALGSRAPVVVAGAFAGSSDERRAWDATVVAHGARWLGAVADPAAVARLQADAHALVHFSRAEVQSLGVLETLAQGTPVVLSDIPSHRELAAAHPGWVRIAADPGDLLPALEALRRDPPLGAAPAIPSWDDVAAVLERVYERVVAP